MKRGRKRRTDLITSGGSNLHGGIKLEHLPFNCVKAWQPGKVSSVRIHSECRRALYVKRFRKKVSFADAFGLNLVSVKEFENIEIADLVKSESSDREEAISTEDFYMFCLFTVPPTPEELERKVEEQMVELESIQLLPKTSTLRGIVRVLNMCYNKLVYVRITLDRWRSHFDLQAEYVPGSSDWKTDRFTFQYTLIPPFDKEGTRVEFCLRYETSEGVFWANNNQMNYVMFFHQKVKENVPQIQDENNHKSKKSCLKVRCLSSLLNPFRHASTMSFVVLYFHPQEGECRGADQRDAKRSYIRYRSVLLSLLPLTCLALGQRAKSASQHSPNTF
uniref:CBM21 domain-containing protein n=1 Tax=Periophthalmus magnuspinnatus TaxID=409849 RepID=A0A3B4B0P0_9GOBI